MLKNESEYNISHTDAESLLSEIITNTILSKYPIHDLQWSKDKSNSYVRQCKIKKLHASSKDLAYDCVIGIRDLEDHVKIFDGIFRVRDNDFVGKAKSILHESEHLNQHLNICQKPLAEKDMDMAKMLMLNDLLEGYKKNTYQYNLSEIDAEIKACHNTVSLINQLSKTDRRLIDEYNNPILDAKECLFQHYKEHPKNRVWKSNIYVHDYDSMMKSLYSLKQMYLTEDRGITFTNHPVDQSILKDIKKSENWKSLFYGDRTGKQYDDKLFAIVSACAPQWVQTHAGVQDEAKRLRKEYPKGFPPLGQALHFVDSLVNRNNQQM